MSIDVNEKGYVDQAFFTDVKAVRLNRKSTGEYILIVFGQDGGEECFYFKSKAPKQFPIFVKHNPKGED